MEHLFRRLTTILGNSMAIKLFDSDSWDEITRQQDSLSDADFLKTFQPTLEMFTLRSSLLMDYAKRLTEIYLLNDLKILEPASGCNIFPANLSRLANCQVIGLEVHSSPAARYCRIQKLPIISPPNWSTWTKEIFDLVVVISYITKPDHNEWARQVTSDFCKNVLYQIRNGAELVLFDVRYADPLINVIHNQKLPIEWKNYPAPGLGGLIFYRKGKPSPRRVEAPE
ncbi:MAG: hypothetical protein ACI8P9_001598 [Parasphingorhabdus sp.]|jgi:hypothetical protein